MTGAVEDAPLTVGSTTSVRADVVVPASPELAFEVFTAQLHEWWPDRYVLTEEPQELLLEPGVGGRWFERAAEGSECRWGEVLVWEPPRELVLSWAVGADWRPDPARASVLAVTFEAAGEGTRVVLEHQDLEQAGDGWEGLRDTFDGEHGWGMVLQRYAGAVAR